MSSPAAFLIGLVSLAAGSLQPIPSPLHPLLPAPLEIALGDADRERLTYLLSVAQWEEANRMTTNLLLRSVGKLGQGYLIADDTRRIPCSELVTIDNLWVKASDNKFGFSLQGRLWHQMKGKTYEDAVKFEEKVGWDGPIQFETVGAPRGHLPLRPAGENGTPDAWGGAWIQALSQRLVTCKIIPAPPPEPKPKPEPKPTATPAANRPGSRPGTVRQVPANRSGVPRSTVPKR